MVDYRALLDEERKDLLAKLEELGVGTGRMIYDSNFADSSQVTAERGEAEALARKLQEALPDTVDLLGIVLGTGLALDQAMNRVSDEMQFIYPELANEFATVVMQVRAGQERAKAFDQLVRRTGIDDIKSLAAMIVQSEKFGTSLSSALNVYAEALRTRRRLRAEAAGGFPEKVTAFRQGMAVHGRYGLPCPRCGEKIQRIRYASNETNYCPRCQTGGRLLADRALSRLLREDWPRTPEELESLKRGAG